MNLYWFSVAGALCVGGCQIQDNATHSAIIESPTETAISHDFEVTAPVGIFSTYLSEEGKAKCDALAVKEIACMDDAIDTQHFFDSLKKNGVLPNALAASEQTDYQVLIANQAVILASPDWWENSLHTLKGSASPLSVELQHFTELTVQWRGLEIDSQLIETHLAMGDEHAPKIVADKVIAEWWSNAQERGLFTAQYLFTALQASDYLNELQVPDTIAAFTRFDTQLFHDPFQGAITRYTHNDFEDALLDITVFPLTTSLEASLEKTLTNILRKEQSDAQIVAQARDLELLVDQPISEFPPGKQLVSDKVYMLAVHAKNASSEPIFATTYVYRQQDKIVKVSTTFPPRIANPLVEQALPAIKVPSESPLMAALRKMAKARSAVN